jgi:UDP-N-acetyl-alpha-D-muramoyl-L-alanyl-L-glutamate epimerase
MKKRHEMMPAQRADLSSDGPLGGWRRDGSEVFRFGQRALIAETGEIRLEYELDGIALVESFYLPEAPFCIPGAREDAVERALDLLHWTAGISYWKAGCPDRFEFSETRPDPWQAEWLTRLWREGLAEFAWQNRLEVEDWPEFPAGEFTEARAGNLGLGDRALVPMGGGKDSLVALERVLAAGQATHTVQIGHAELIREVAGVAGQPHLIVRRRVDPALGQLNQRGAFNGHVPITAINSAVLALLAVVGDYRRVIFANERSADEHTLIDERGRAVNHQFSKSLVFEHMFADWTGRYIAADLEVFSILRRDRELAICREFAGLEQYHSVFSSCNRNFHLDGARTQRWCGQCPKCHFVFLAMAPFLPPDRMRTIFAHDLLADAQQSDGFRQLLALDGVKPFECVGEAVEARAALAALATSERWRGHVIVSELAPLLKGLEFPALDSLCEPVGDHLIPDDLLAEA